MKSCLEGCFNLASNNMGQVCFFLRYLRKSIFYVFVLISLLLLPVCLRAESFDLEEANKAKDFLLESMGIDPITREDASFRNYNELFKSLEKDAVSVGAVIKDVGLDELVRLAEENDQIRGVIFRREKPPLQLIKVFYHKGNLSFQAFWGDNLIVLMDKEDLDNQGYTTSWVIVEKESNGIPFRIGRGLLEVNHIKNSFGILLPGEKKSLTFSLKNIGSVSLELGTPKSGCSCTTTELIKNLLNPGDTIPMEVHAGWKGNALKSDIFLSVIDINSGSERILIFETWGNAIKTIEYMPDSLNFLVKERNVVLERTVRISEVDTEFIEIFNYASIDLPIDLGIEEKNINGLRNYMLRVSLDPSELSTGEYSGKIKIDTSSKYHPEIIIPVDVEVKPLIEPVPKFVSFSIGNGSFDMLERKVIFRNNTGAPFKITDIRGQDYCYIHVNGENELVILPNKSKFKNKNGVITWDIDLTAKLEHEIENIKIKCLYISN